MSGSAAAAGGVEFGADRGDGLARRRRVEVVESQPLPRRRLVVPQHRPLGDQPGDDDFQRVELRGQAREPLAQLERGIGRRQIRLDVVLPVIPLLVVISVIVVGS